MRKMTLSTIALLATGFTACSEDPGPRITEACAGFQNDARAVSAIVGTGTDIGGFCECLADEMLGLPEAEQAGLVGALETVTGRLGSAGDTTDSVVDAIEDASEADDATQADKDLAGDVERLGELVEGTFDKVAENDGACVQPG